MLESLVSWVLNTYIGDYLENLNADQLSVGLLQGQIELENVPLKPSALKKFDIPLRIKAGVIGKLKLSIPLYRLRSEPWVIAVSDVYVVLEPNPREFDMEAAEDAEWKRKQSQLDALLSFHKQQLGQNLQESQGGWLAYGASFVSLIVENIQLLANNVHIRYEDNVTIPNEPFACGIQIEKLSVQSADASWKTGFVQRQQGKNMFKVLELKQLILYWNSVPVLISPDSHEQLIDLSSHSSKHQGVTDMFILQPVNVMVRMEKNSSKLPLKGPLNSPRLNFEIDVEELNLHPSQQQLKGMRLLTDEWSRFERGRQYRKWKPNCTVEQKPRLWWKFAIRCQVDLLHNSSERSTWTFAIQRAKMVNSYTKSYRRLLTKQNFTKADEALMKQIEREWSYSELLLLRDAVFKSVSNAKLRSSASSADLFLSVDTSPSLSTVGSQANLSVKSAAVTPTTPSQSGFLTSWFTSWYYGAAKEESGGNSELEQLEGQILSELDLPSDLKEDIKMLENQFEPDILDDSTYLRRDNLFAACQLKIEKATFSYLDEIASHKITVLGGELDCVTLKGEWSPRRRSVSTNVAISSLSCVMGMSFEQENGKSADPHGFGLGQPFARVLIDQAVVLWEKTEDFMSTAEVKLGSAHVESLLEESKTEPQYLIRIESATRELVPKTYLSTSCPDVSSFVDSEGMELSTSLPSGLASPAAMARPIYESKRPLTPPTTPRYSRRESFSSSSVAATLSVKFVRKEHPEFHSVYNGIDCAVDGTLEKLEILFNQQSWILLLDFLGFNNPPTPDQFPDEKAEAETIKRILLIVPQFKLTLNKPSDGYQLARIAAGQLRLDLTLLSKEFKVAGAVEQLSIEDGSPLHSRLYPERLTVQAGAGREGLTFFLRKWSHNDPHLKREWDAYLELNSTKGLQLIHTQRFVQELLAFVQHFLQLQDLLSRVKTAVQDGRVVPHASHGFRLRLLLNLIDVKIVLPVSSASDDGFVVEIDQLLGENAFLFNSQRRTTGEPQHTITSSSDDVDCLLDIMHLSLSGLQLFPASRKHSAPIGDSTLVFKDFCIAKQQTKKIFSDGCCAVVVVERNLDSSLSHKLPDMSVHAQTSSMSCTITTDIYKTFRAFLDKNLGEPVPHFPMPLEVSVNPSSVRLLSGKTCLGLCFQLDLTDVLLTCVKSDGVEPLLPLAQLDIKSANLCCKMYSDQSKDFQLLVQDVLIDDIRFKDLAVNKRPSVFPRMICRRSSTLADVITSDTQTLVEISYHVSPLSDNRLTVVLFNSKLMFLLDWYYLALDFLNAEDQSPDAANRPLLPVMVNSGIITKRIAQVPQVAKNFTLRVNLNNCELILPENPASPSCIALVITTTAAIINYKVSLAVPSLSCNIKGAEIFSRLLGRDENTSVKLAEPFNCDFEIDPEKRDTILTQMNYPLMVGVVHTHRLEAKVGDVHLQMSYKDFLVMRAVWNSVAGQFSHSSQTREPHPDSPKFMLEKAEMKLDRVSFVWIDDLNAVLVPLFRFTVSDALIFERINQWKGEGSFQLRVDYYSRRVSGWEPFVEPWSSNCSWIYPSVDNTVRLDISSSGMQNAADVLDITVTPCLVETLETVKGIFAKIPEAFACGIQDLPVNCYHRVENCPYLLVNDTGSSLHFTTDVLRPDGQHHKPLTPQSSNWFEVATGQSYPFQYKRPDSLFQEDGKAPHQISIRVNDFTELSPISLDRVGTYFRLSKFIMDNQGGGSTLKANSLVRIVIEITLMPDFRKMIRVRSALLFVNCLECSVELRLENNVTFLGDDYLMVVPAGEVVPAPIRYVNSKIFIRPCTSECETFCAKAVQYVHVNDMEKPIGTLYECAVTKKEVPFRFVVSVKRECFPSVPGLPPIGHSLRFLPPLVVLNLLPTEVQTFITPDNDGFPVVIETGKKFSFTSVNLQKPFDINFRLENFQCNRNLRIDSGWNTPEMLLPLEMLDPKSRKLILDVRLKALPGGVLKVILSVPCWIVNKSGLPLIFRQEGAQHEAAGQFDDHETARSVEPLMFSFSDPDAPAQVVMRLGRGSRSSGPRWSKKFVIEPGITFRELSVASRDQSPDTIYNIGVEVRNGLGLYDNTTFILLTPRFHIDNRSSHHLEISQKFAVQTPQHDQPQCRGQYSVSPHCTLAWHWPRQDLDPLVCIKRADLPHWSQGFRIDIMQSFHLNIRNHDGTPSFIRVEIILRGALYYVTLSDAESFPPPMRLENLSFVPVMYNQKGCVAGHLKSILRPGCIVDYAWDDPMLSPELEVTVSGNRANDYNLLQVGVAQPLVYENHFYIAMVSTFKPHLLPMRDDNVELVFDVMPKGKVILARKDPKRPTQLWRMTKDGLLVNVGFGIGGARFLEGARRDSSDVSGSSDMVLDILSSSLDPTAYEPLMLRQPDSRRKLSQRWHFTEDGRLACDYQSLYVQAADKQLRSGVPVVLGVKQPVSETGWKKEVPLEQWVERQKSKAGSGRLSVAIEHEGPTQILRINDMEMPQKLPVGLQHGSEGNGVKVVLNVCLQSVGLSVVSSEPEELFYARLSGFWFTYTLRGHHHNVTTYLMGFQADNQLLGSDWQFVHIKPTITEDGTQAPVVTVSVDWNPMKTYDAFENFVIEVGKVALKLDEVLLWKLVKFLGYKQPIVKEWNSPNVELERPDQSKGKRVYFKNLSLSCRKLYLSIITSGLLTPDLREIKHSFNLRLIRFENASVKIQPYRQIHYFESVDFLMDTVQKYFAAQLKGQALKILGSVDFLGNPLGLFDDVTYGFSELLTEGSVGGFFVGVTHGLSNSAAKLTSALSAGVGALAMDEKHQEFRETSLRPSYSSNAIGHLVTGVKGFGIGILGGTTSIIAQSYDGARKDGLEGFTWGLAKGMVGTVTKPVQGVLDLFSGVATATKEAVAQSSTRNRTRFADRRVRFPRVTRSLHGCLPRYSESLAVAHSKLLTLNNQNRDETCLAVEDLFKLPAGEELFAFVTTDNVYLVKQGDDEHQVVLTVHYSQVTNCSTVLGLGSNNFSVELKQKGNSSSGDSAMDSSSSRERKSVIKCKSYEVASRLCDEISFAKFLHDDKKRSLTIIEDVSTDL